MHEGEDERPLSQRDHAVVSDGGADQPPVTTCGGKAVTTQLMTETFAPLVPPRPPPAAPVRRREGPPV